MDERMRFVTRVERGERMTDLCAEFGISRKTGYKLWARWRDDGAAGLADLSRRPHHTPTRTTPALERLVLAARAAHPTWGPRKLRAWLAAQHPGVALPSASTLGEVLKRHGVVAPRRRRARGTTGAPPGLTAPAAANDVWCADFKGQFRLGDGTYCYPLTITDLQTRFVVRIEALRGTYGAPARAAFERAFAAYGLPRRVRTDNGVPFASHGLAGLSRLSVWWLRLGIVPERIRPGRPQENGAHERMHLTLKRETTRPAAHDHAGQQARFDAWVRTFNRERPHEALGQTPPAAHYAPSSRPYPQPLPPLTYPLHDDVRRVGPEGHVRFGGRAHVVFLTRALAGEEVGVRELEAGVWRISYAALDLGTYSMPTRRFEPAVHDA